MIILQVFALGFLTALAVTGFMVRAGLGDIADDRSAHKDIIPTGGGIGLVAGLGAAGLALGFHDFYPALTPTFAPFLSLVFAAAMLGLVDDVLVLSARVKFAVLLVLCGAAVKILGPVTALPFTGGGIGGGAGGAFELPIYLGFAGSLLWMFVVVNAVNFMDGANGLMGSFMFIASLALFGVAMMSGAQGAAVLSFMLCAALLGFLPYNLRAKACIFSGDVGALTAGFVYAGAVLMLAGETSSPAAIYAGPLLILPFLADVFLTLIRRVRAKDNILMAHNKHLYQRLMRSGWSHLRVTWLFAVMALFLGNGVLLAAYKNVLQSPILFLGLIGISIIGYYFMSKKLPD